MRQYEYIGHIKNVSIIISALAVIVGIVLLVWPGISAVTICYLIGATVILSGIIRLVGYFAKDMYNLNFQFDFALGVFLIALGIILLCNPKNTVSALHLVIGVIILADSVFKLQTSIEAKHFGLNKWWMILCVAIICSLFGLLLIAYPFKMASLLIRIMGIAVIVNALENIFMVLYTVKIKKKSGPISVEYIVDADEVSESDE